MLSQNRTQASQEFQEESKTNFETQIFRKRRSELESSVLPDPLSHKRFKLTEAEEREISPDESSSGFESDSEEEIDDPQMKKHYKCNRTVDLPRDGINYIGLLLGPKGTHQKKLEEETGCKIMFRSSGSISDRTNEDHCIIRGPDDAAVKKAVSLIQNKVSLDSKAKKEIYKKQQEMKELREQGRNTKEDKNSEHEAKIRVNIPIPDGCVGLIIGKKGDKIKTLQQQSKTHIQVRREMDEEENSKIVIITGTKPQCTIAKKLVLDIVLDWEQRQKRKLSNDPRYLTKSKKAIFVPEDCFSLLVESGMGMTHNPDICYVQELQDNYKVKIIVPIMPDVSISGRIFKILGKTGNATNVVYILNDIIMEKLHEQCSPKASHNTQGDKQSDEANKENEGAASKASNGEYDSNKTTLKDSSLNSENKILNVSQSGNKPVEGKNITD